MIKHLETARKEIQDVQQEVKMAKSNDDVVDKTELIVINKEILQVEMFLKAPTKEERSLRLAALNKAISEYPANDDIIREWIRPIQQRNRTELELLQKEVLESSDEAEIKPTGDLPFPDANMESATWNNDNFFKYFKNGGFTPEDRTARTEQLDNGVTVFRDIGISFYIVKKEDLNGKVSKRRGRIIDKLSKIHEFNYLKKQSLLKTKSINVPNSSLVAKMLVPIPLEKSERNFSQEQFLNYAYLAIQEMQNDPVYGSDVKRILKNVTLKELLAFMLATARQESGGTPLGKFEFHRWEPRKKVFSFSIMHVVMEGPGLKARQKLNLTEGQLYHPRNAVKLALAFFIEKSKLLKSKKKPEDFFPVKKNLGSLAIFYNGPNWRRTNPQYANNITKFHSESLSLLNQSSLDVASLLMKKTSAQEIAEKETAEETPKGVQYVFIENKTLYGTISRADNLFSKNSSQFSSLGNDKKEKHNNIEEIAKEILSRLQKKYQKKYYFKTDQIAIWSDDARGVYVVLKRPGATKETKFIIPLKYVMMKSRKQRETARSILHFRTIGNNRLARAILNSNADNRDKKGRRIIKTDNEAYQFAIRLEKYTKKVYGFGPRKTDKIAIGKDRFGAHIIFWRPGRNKVILRLKKQ